MDPGQISPYPLSLTDDELSSTTSHAIEFADLHMQSSLLLGSYLPVSAHDATQGVLRAALEYLPMEGRMTMMREIVALGEDWERLKQLAHFFIDAILKPMRLHRPPSSICPSPNPDAAAEIQTLMALVESSSRSRQAPLKAFCLRRDGHRCALSGVRDRNSIISGHVSRGGQRITPTQCAHVIPFGLRRLDGLDVLEVEQKSTIWWALYRYFPALDGLISPNTVNRPENAFTAEFALHDMFDSMDFALEPSHEHVNAYFVRSFTIPPDLPDAIVLRSREPMVPLPHPALLRTHFVVASILHVSGLGKWINASLDPEFWDGVPGAAASDGSTDLVTLVERRLLIGT